MWKYLPVCCELEWGCRIMLCSEEREDSEALADWSYCTSPVAYPTFVRAPPWLLKGLGDNPTAIPVVACVCPFCPGEIQLQSGRRQVSRLVGSSCKQPGIPVRGHPFVPVWSTEPGGSSAGPVARAALSRVLTAEGTARLVCWSWDRAVSLGNGFHPVGQVTCIPGSARRQ